MGPLGRATAQSTTDSDGAHGRRHTTEVRAPQPDLKTMKHPPPAPVRVRDVDKCVSRCSHCPPPCNIQSGHCSFTGPWTVTRSSLRVLRRVAAFCRPLRPVLLLVSIPRSRSPIVGPCRGCAGCGRMCCLPPPPPNSTTVRTPSGGQYQVPSSTPVPVSGSLSRGGQGPGQVPRPCTKGCCFATSKYGFCCMKNVFCPKTGSL